MKHLFHIGAAAILLSSGCSVFFNPDSHLEGGGDDGGVDGGIDGAPDGTIDGAPDAPPPDGTLPDGMTDGGGPDGPVLCTRDAKPWMMSGAEVRLSGTDIAPLLTVAATVPPPPKPANAVIGYIDEGTAWVNVISDIDSIDDDATSTAAWDIGSPAAAQGGPLAPLVSIALREAEAPGDIAVVLTGQPNAVAHGAFGGLVTDEGMFNGLAASPRSDTAVSPYLATITGRPGNEGRFIFRVIPTDGPEYGSTQVTDFGAENYLTGGMGDVPDADQAWMVGSDHYLALIQWNADMWLWPGTGVPITAPGGGISTAPYTSDITYVGPGEMDTDRYVVSFISSGAIVRRLIQCTACTGPDCDLVNPDACSEVDENMEPSMAERTMIATDYAPGIGFVQVTNEGGFLRARFFGPDLARAVDSDGAVVDIPVVDLGRYTIFALDVDTIRRDDGDVDRTTVAIGYGLNPDGGEPTGMVTMATVDVAVADDCTVLP